MITKKKVKKKKKIYNKYAKFIKHQNFATKNLSITH